MDLLRIMKLCSENYIGIVTFFNSDKQIVILGKRGQALGQLKFHPEQIPTLHSRASDWYEQANLPCE